MNTGITGAPARRASAATADVAAAGRPRKSTVTALRSCMCWSTIMPTGRPSRRPRSSPRTAPCRGTTRVPTRVRTRSIIASSRGLSNVRATITIGSNRTAWAMTCSSQNPKCPVKSIAPRPDAIARSTCPAPSNSTSDIMSSTRIASNRSSSITWRPTLAKAPATTARRSSTDRSGRAARTLAVAVFRRRWSQRWNSHPSPPPSAAPHRRGIARTADCTARTARYSAAWRTGRDRRGAPAVTAGRPAQPRAAPQ